MPAGKLGAIAGSVWIRRLDGDVIMRSSLPYGVNLRSLKPYRSARTPKKQPDAAAIRDWRWTLREAFRFYQVDCRRSHPTATQLRENLGAVLIAAKRYLASGKASWADKLLDRLDSDKNTEANVRREIGIDGSTWIGFKRELREFCARRIRLQASLGVAADIAGIDIDSLVSESGRWHDPALFRLVAVVAPIWTEVTGRTAALVSPDNDDRKLCRFAEWLGSMLELIGQPRPSVGSVVDIVRAQKSENPAPVKAEKN
jgi:hypothetical protein